MAALSVLTVAVVASLGLGVFPLGRVPTTSTTMCAGCGTDLTVVDVIMPYIGTADNVTNPNRVVNMTQGAAKTFEVDVYPTAPLSFVLSFNAFLVGTPAGQAGSGAGESPTATFQPTTLSVAANAKGVTSMTVVVPAAAAKGVYDAVVTATNAGNSSQGWGLYFEIQVL